MPSRAARTPAPHRTLRRARAMLLAAGLIAVALPATACSSRAARARADAQPATSLRVRNQGFLDVNIYAVRGGQRVRLGTVTGNTSQLLRIPANLLNGITPMRFIADPIGQQRTPTSDEIVVTPGDEVQLIIPPV